MAFPKFALLPQELRDQIWEDAVWQEDGRVVEMNQNIRPPVGQDHWSCEYTSSTRIPGLLHACHDSRLAALQRWQLRFAFLDEPLPHPAKVFFDFETDTLYFGTKFSRIEYFREGVDTIDCFQLRRVALEIRVQYFPHLWRYYDIVGFFAINFPMLEHIVCVERFHPTYWDAAMANDVCPLSEARLSNAIQHAANHSIPAGSWRSYWVEHVRLAYEARGWRSPEFSIVLDTQRPVASHGNWIRTPMEHISGVS